MWTKPLVRATAWHRAVAILALVGTIFVLVFLTRSATKEAQLRQVARAIPYHPQVALASFEEPLPEVALPAPFTLRRGQTLAHLLRDHGVVGTDSVRAIEALDEFVDLRKIKAGETGLVYYGETGELAEMRLLLSGRGYLTLERQGEDWQASFRELVREVRTRVIAGQLETFLFADIEKAGGVPQVAFAMSDVLQWDLDFNRDLRRGDRFRVVYEEVLLDGRFADIGKVMALVYENRGIVHEAYLYGEAGEEGYYDSEGQPLQKMFLRSPLPFTRVTSRFSHRRFHPVLKTYRPHYGVDFGAPKGTPVRATATGTVTLAGRNGGAGNMVRLRHANGYETSYLHLSGFAKGVRKGKKVRQGTVIGFVGSTGLSTGPHLDYRVKRSGRYVDPMKLENRPAEPIDPAVLPAFLERRRALAAMLDSSSFEEDLPRFAALAEPPAEPRERDPRPMPRPAGVGR